MEVTNEQVISRLVESEAGKKIAGTILREQTAALMDMRAKIEILRKERGEKSRDLDDAAAATLQRVNVARKTLADAEQEHRQAVFEQKTTAAHYDGRIQKLQRQLTASAPATIDTFLDWLADQEHEATETEITKRGQKTDRIYTHSDEVIRAYWTNAQSLQNRLKAIREARADAQQLKGRILDGADLDERLEALRESLPAVSMQFSHEK